MAFSAEHRAYNITLYNNLYYIQTCAGKTPIGKNTRQEIWVGSMARAPKSPSYEGYTTGRSLPLFPKHAFEHSMENSK